MDDSLLVAKKRKKRSGVGGKLVAEKCWPIGEIAIVDVKDSIGRTEYVELAYQRANSPFSGLELTNVIKIRRGKETHVFRTDALSEKKKLLATFRRVSEELATKKRKERETEHDRRRSVWTGDVRLHLTPCCS